jgi:hypothetical protein
VTTLLAGGSDPVITKKPTGAWSHAVYDAMKGDICSDPSGFVHGQQLSLHCFCHRCSAVHVDERLPISVTHDVAPRNLVRSLPGSERTFGESTSPYPRTHRL